MCRLSFIYSAAAAQSSKKKCERIIIFLLKTKQSLIRVKWPKYILCINIVLTDSKAAESGVSKMLGLQLVIILNHFSSWFNRFYFCCCIKWLNIVQTLIIVTLNGLFSPTSNKTQRYSVYSFKTQRNAGTLTTEQLEPENVWRLCTAGLSSFIILNTQRWCAQGFSN